MVMQECSLICPSHGFCRGQAIAYIWESLKSNVLVTVRLLELFMKKVTIEFAAYSCERLVRHIFHTHV
jgi:hypothetical protein